MLAANNTLLVRAPASLRLLGGEAEVLGAPLGRNRQLTVGREKQVALEARTKADLEILLGTSGEIFEVEGSTIPASWKMAGHALAEMEQGKVMVVGMTDVGKSTLCAYLTNRLLLRGLSPTIVDGDIGQSDIGPPTTMGSSVARSFISSLDDLKPEAMIFIGHTSPSQVENKIVNGLKRLSDRMKDSLTIINTDGWVLDPEAVSYKIGMIDATEPDVVIGLANGTELQPILSGSRAHSLSIETAKEVLARSRSDRREIRSTNYRRFLEGARTRAISMQGISFSTPKGFPQLDGSNAQELSNLVVGLLNNDGYMLQIGILIETGNMTARIYCRPVQALRKIEVGYVKLSKTGSELGYFEPRQPY